LPIEPANGKEPKEMSDITRTVHEAMRLMKTGDLRAATQAIQRGLRGGAQPSHAASQPTVCGAVAAADVEGEYRVVPDRPGDVPGGRAPSWESVHGFKCDAGAMQYKLFIPEALGDAPPPLIVMLHGCTQSPDDFARGTRMNALAQERGYVVAYPAQSKSRNPRNCWSWFLSENQRRGCGEAAIIAELTRQLVKAHGLDERRVYIAGLSAGGAMAAVLGSTYPELYAAIGVHSGLPVGAAHDIPSAFAAMKDGPRGSFTAGTASQVPAIVFHGDGDTTVDPGNGAAVIAQSIGAANAVGEAGAAAGRQTVERGSVSGGREYTRTLFTHPDGSVAAEQWVVHGAPHAWSGGDPAGSYTDPLGPDASGHMLRFFSGFRRG
jgi:poly(hydroxyalkanoate) depolymerase family esterase